jgi:hypothetical protein
MPDVEETLKPESPSTQEGFSESKIEVPEEIEFSEDEDVHENAVGNEEAAEYEASYLDTLPGKGGRPPIYSSPEELQKAVEMYFLVGIKKKKVFVNRGNRTYVEMIEVPTITGLSYFLGFADRSSFYNYGEKEEFSYTIKRCKQFIEKHYEELLQTGNVTGAIFALKNFKWHDKQEHEHSGNLLTDILKNVDGK